MLEINNLITESMNYYDQIIKDRNSRYCSWAHCYKQFKNARHRKNTDKDIDFLSLNLAFYLASYGMYRGSSFLLKKDYKVHNDAVGIILQEKYDSLFGIECERLLEKDNLFKFDSIYSELEDNYEKINQSVTDRKKVTTTLITKILLGTLGCTPAYDKYFKFGLSKTLDRISDSSKHPLLDCKEAIEDSLSEIARYYMEYNNCLDKICSVYSTQELYCPQMRVIDMGFWQFGYDHIKTSDKVYKDKY